MKSMSTLMIQLMDLFRIDSVVPIDSQHRAKYTMFNNVSNIIGSQDNLRIRLLEDIGYLLGQSTTMVIMNFDFVFLFRCFG